jgi:hypothetical protein
MDFVTEGYQDLDLDIQADRIHGVLVAVTAYFLYEPRTRIGCPMDLHQAARLYRDLKNVFERQEVQRILRGAEEYRDLRELQEACGGRVPET